MTIVNHNHINYFFYNKSIGFDYTLLPRLLLAIISIIGIVKPLVVIKFIKLLKKWGTDRYSKNVRLCPNCQTSIERGTNDCLKCNSNVSR